MDFNLSREHLLVRKMMAEFTENEVKPIAAETDEKSEYPRENIEKLFEANQIDFVRGTATIRRDRTVEVNGEDGREYYHGKNIIIASGAKPL